MHAGPPSGVDSFDDPVPRGVGLSLGETLRVFEVIGDARSVLLEPRTTSGPQDELATVTRMLHGKLWLDEVGVR